MTITIYGIPNCDQIKKTLAWFIARGVDVAFHDYKKRGIDVSTLRNWMTQVDWSVLVNRAGTTWRKLPEDIRASVNSAAAAAQVLRNNPTLIKRPVLVNDQTVVVGFDAVRFTALIDHAGTGR